jgi:TrmH family RNA methyltransferase
MKAAVAAPRQRISSAANPLWKEIRRAVRQGGLTGDGCVVADSFHLLEEALRSGRDCEMVLVSEDARPRVEAIVRASRRNVPVRVVDNSLLSKAAAAETPQGVIALVRPPSWTLDDLFGRDSLVVVLDGVQDPGNAGAMVRAAEAFGATGIVFLRDTASPFNPKTLRASAGSLFRLPYVFGIEREAARQKLRARKLQVLAAGAESGQPPDRVNWKTPTALVIGSEAHGVSAALRRDATAVRIPTRGVESLNASVAAAVLLYEASRQRGVTDSRGKTAVRDVAGKAPA